MDLLIGYCHASKHEHTHNVLLAVHYGLSPVSGGDKWLGFRVQCYYVLLPFVAALCCLFSGLPCWSCADSSAAESIRRLAFLPQLRLEELRDAVVPIESPTFFSLSFIHTKIDHFSFSFSKKQEKKWNNHYIRSVYLVFYSSMNLGWSWRRLFSSDCYLSSSDGWVVNDPSCSGRVDPKPTTGHWSFIYT